MKLCATCGKPQFGHPPCVVCQNLYGTTRMCAYCESDPVNADWKEDRADVEEFNEGRAAPQRLGELTDKRLRAPSALERRILDLFTKGPPDAWVEREYRDRHGRRRGTRRYRNRAVKVDLSYREIARRVGCSHTFVIRVVRRHSQ